MLLKRVIRIVVFRKERRKTTSSNKLFGEPAFIVFFTKSTQSTQNWKHQSVEITEVWHRWSGSDPLAGFVERKSDKSYPKMKILESVEVSRIGRDIRTQNTQSKNPWNSDISRVLSGGWSGARIRYYRISLIALNIEKKGVDAVRRVSVFQSVTVSVTITVKGTELKE